MSDYSLTANNISKNFGRRQIFKNICFEFKEKGVYGIAGMNGSGKSTLVKIIAGIISPASGKINHFINKSVIPPDKLYAHIGFASPYLTLYDEFSAEENMQYFSRIRDVEYDKEKINDLLDKLRLADRKNDLVKGYSSGMKQRLKLIFALAHKPDLVIFDEPVSNLDSFGKEAVYEIIQEEMKMRIIIIASNEESDLALCKEIIKLGK